MCLIACPILFQGLSAAALLCLCAGFQAGLGGLDRGSLGGGPKGQGAPAPANSLSPPPSCPGPLGGAGCGVEVFEIVTRESLSSTLPLWDDVSGG